MKAHQNSDAANASRSGGVNMQGQNISEEYRRPDKATAATNVPPRGTTNGGK